MSSKTIPLEALRLTVASAQRRGQSSPLDGKPLARFAAFSQYPDLNIGCRERGWGRDPYPHLPMHFGPMSKGDMERLVARVRCERGLPEVRRTWNTGLRALQAELADGVLR